MLHVADLNPDRFSTRHGDSRSVQRPKGACCRTRTPTSSDGRAHPRRGGLPDNVKYVKVSTSSNDARLRRHVRAAYEPAAHRPDPGADPPVGLHGMRTGSGRGMGSGRRSHRGLGQEAGRPHWRTTSAPGLLADDAGRLRAVLSTAQERRRTPTEVRLRPRAPTPRPAKSSSRTFRA